jgi:molybdopterin synthase catalytic subunit
MISEGKSKNIFLPGAIDPVFIAESIRKHQSKTAIGGHSIFLGQVRADIVSGKKIIAIDYSSYEEMAQDKMYRIREDAFAKYELTCLHVYHSIGRVASGDICFFVFTSAAHRKAAIEACSEIVERIKTEIPIWGREIFEDETHQWKENK